jgi:hypothetical protein
MSWATGGDSHHQHTINQPNQQNQDQMVT